MSKSIILICANERPNAGERDYAVAISAELEKRGVTDVCAMKIQRNNDDSFGSPSSSSTLPVSNKKYTSLPEFSLDLAQEFIAAELRKGNSVEILGAGQSTLTELAQISDMLDPENTQARCSYLTHMIEDQYTVDTIIAKNIQIYAPTTQQNLEEKFSRADMVRLQTISTVPHTTTRSKIESDAHFFLETENGQTLNKTLQRGGSFVTAVLNAGFDVSTTNQGKIRVPYFAHEAKRDGAALGALMSADTALVLIDGGPRNALDRNAGELTREAFIEGYKTAQAEKSGSPQIIYEEFKPDMDYNSINAMLSFADHPSCKGFISNAEGYGTMDAVIQFADNQKILTGMFPFEANERDTTGQRMENIKKYDQMGISLIHSTNGRTTVERHPEQQKTPRQKADPVPAILDHLGISNQSSAMHPGPAGRAITEICRP